MGIYIIEDDDTMIEILEDLIEDHEMGEVVGSSTDPSEALLQVPALRPDIIMIDFLMPGKDGAQLVRELKEAGCTAKFIMVSQVSSKDMIGKAYDAGIEFFISKPINLIEVKSVLNTVTQQIKNERTVAQLRNLFMTEIGFGDQKGTAAGGNQAGTPAGRNTAAKMPAAETRQEPAIRKCCSSGRRDGSQIDDRSHVSPAADAAACAAISATRCPGRGTGTRP